MTKVDQARRGYRGPRPRTRIQSMTGAGTVVSSITITNPLATPATGSWVGNMLLNPPANAGSNDPGTAVLLNYQLYKFSRARIRYTPMVGTTTPGTIYIGYIDNPEMIQKWVYNTYTAAQKLAICKTCPNSVRGPVWMENTLDAGMTVRRPKYSVDSTLSDDVNQIDRTTHGLFILASEGIPNSQVFGVFSIDYAATGYHLQLGGTSGL